MDNFIALLCGVCSYACENEGSLRAHTLDLDEDGDTHDGEPWGTMTLKVGGRYTWSGEATSESIVITAIVWNDDDEVWIQSQGERGVWWNELARFCEAVS